MKRHFAAAILLCIAQPAAAQEYFFAVPHLAMEVFILGNSSAHVSYDITFDNRGHAIDVVDIGVPHKGYHRNSVLASIDGYELDDIRRSEYVDPGYEVHLGGREIARGASGTLHTEFDVPRMVYSDTTRGDYASFQITPTWFGDRYVAGQSLVDIVVHLPGGIEPDEVVWHDRRFSAKGIAGDDKHVVVGWRFESTRLTGPHRVGLSFPRGTMSGITEVTRLELFREWFVRTPGMRIGSIVIFLGGFGWLFFRFTGGTGVSVFLFGVISFLYLFNKMPLSVLGAMVPLAPLLYTNERSLRRRRLRYLPAVAQVEGGGIKRGLTAQEAAVLLERPLGNVLGLVIFGLLKKGIVRQVQETPLVVAVNDAYRLPESGELKAVDVALAMSADARKKRSAYRHKTAREFYRAAAQNNKTVIHAFEHPFLVQLQLHPGEPVSKIEFGSAMRLHIERVARRLQGFDLSDTQDYYRSIVDRAIRMARAVGSVEMRDQAIDANLEWLLMGDDTNDVFDRGGYHYRPSWSRGGWSGGGSGGGLSGGGKPQIGGSPSFADVSASFAGWSENTMSNLAGAIQPGSLNFGDLPSSGVVDLSGADHVTGEILKGFFKGGGSGGSGGGGCACAGCACACACAGGGR